MIEPGNFFVLLNNVTGKSKTSQNYPSEDDIGARITYQKQVPQLFTHKFVSIVTDTSSNAHMMPWSMSLKLKPNIKTMFLQPVSCPEIVLLIHN